MLRFIYSLFFLVIFITGHAQTTSLQPGINKADIYIQKTVQDWQVAGCAVGIIYKDSLVFAKGYGYRNIAEKLPVTDKTYFILGSNTKLFTSIAASMLHAEKKLNLDKPVRTYMPELQFATGELDEKLTLRDMLSHRSGVPRWDGFWFGANYAPDELLSRLKYLTPVRGYRETFLYNNNYYATAGFVSGKVYGSNWEDLITKKILRPLDMPATCFNVKDAFEKGEMGYDYIIDQQDQHLKALTNADYFCSCIQPAGIIISNVQEISHWAIALLNKGMYKGKQVIPQAAIDETLRPNNLGFGRFKYPEIVDAGYGLGRDIASYKGHAFLFHGGSAGGYKTEISFFPADSMGIIVLSNTVQSTNMVAALVFGIADRLLKLDETPWSQRMLQEQQQFAINTKKQLDSLRAFRVKNTMPSHILEDYAGTYESKIYGTIKITPGEDHLELHYRYMQVPLEHFHYDQFWTAESVNYAVYPQLYPVYRLNFFTDNKGKIYKFQASIINDPETEFIKTGN